MTNVSAKHCLKLDLNQNMSCVHEKLGKNWDKCEDAERTKSGCRKIVYFVQQKTAANVLWMGSAWVSCALAQSLSVRNATAALVHNLISVKCSLKIAHLTV